MALTNRGKQYAMEHGDLPRQTTPTATSATTWQAGTELNGHGYARKEINHSRAHGGRDRHRHRADQLRDLHGVSDASAQDADQWALYDAATGGNQIYEPEDFTDRHRGAGERPSCEADADLRAVGLRRRCATHHRRSAGPADG